jgi:hypothetical protein
LLVYRPTRHWSLRKVGALLVEQLEWTFFSNQLFIHFHFESWVNTFFIPCLVCLLIKSCFILTFSWNFELWHQIFIYNGNAKQWRKRREWSINQIQLQAREAQVKLARTLNWTERRGASACGMTWLGFNFTYVCIYFRVVVVRT